LKATPKQSPNVKKFHNFPRIAHSCHTGIFQPHHDAKICSALNACQAVSFAEDRSHEPATLASLQSPLPQRSTTVSTVLSTTVHRAQRRLTQASMESMDKG